MNMRKISVFCGSVLAWGVVAVSGFTSCDDSMSFTTDRGALLSFSTDTVRFDTVISTVGSSTRQLMVYNRNAGRGHTISRYARETVSGFLQR